MHTIDCVRSTHKAGYGAFLHCRQVCNTRIAIEKYGASLARISQLVDLSSHTAGTCVIAVPASHLWGEV